MAGECWMSDGTIPEPAKHQRPESAAVDNEGETIPQRLQVLTNDEAYVHFQDKYTSKVKSVMKRKVNAAREKHRNETVYNQKVKARLTHLEDKFPSKQWFINRKPKETKLNNDHTTGLCKDCYSTRINYESLIKHARSKCQCKTKSCPNWSCLCDGEEDCECDPVCSCDDCVMCQVKRCFTFRSHRID